MTSTARWNGSSAHAKSRDPIVCPMPLAELRVGELRGTASYWKRGAVDAETT